MKRGKRYKKISELVDKQKYYELEEAVDLVKKTASVSLTKQLN